MDILLFLNQSKLSCSILRCGSNMIINVTLNYAYGPFKLKIKGLKDKNVIFLPNPEGGINEGKGSK